MKILLKILLVVSGLVLVGCGGGGEKSPTGAQVDEQETVGEGLVYTGKNTPAELNKETAQDFIETLNVSYADMIDIPDGSQGKIVKKTFSLIQRFDKKTNGSKSGTVEVTEKEIDNITKETIAIFKNFNDGDAETIDGKVTYLITVDEQESFFIKKMDIKLELLNIKDSEIDIVMGGILTMIASDDGKRKTFTQNIIIKNNTDNTMVKFEDLKIVLNDYDQELSYNGKIYHSEKGYIEVSTPVELRYDETGSPMVGGEILYESENASIRERIAYDNRIRVELDEGKDGSVDEVEVYDADTLEVVPNTAPVIAMSFPQSVYTDTNMSEVAVNVYDPDLDGFSTSYEWTVNGEVKGSEIVLDSTLFKKHDILKLTVVATDDRVGNVKSSTQSKEQEVLNSRPIITESFGRLTLDLGKTENLIYSISDADNDEIMISWKHYFVHSFYGEETINEYYNPPFSGECELAIQDYDMNNPNAGYITLSREEQEDFNRTYCLEDIPGQIVQYAFIQGKVFDAVAPGLYFHEMIASDGDYNRTRVFDSNVSKTDIIERTVNNHNQYSINRAYSIYMKDFDNDGNKDLIYMGSITKHDEGSSFTEPSGEVITIDPYDYQVPVLVIEYRNGDTVLKKEQYEINNLELKNFYVNDLDGDGKLDILITHTNGYSPPTNSKFSIMLQNEQGSLDVEVEANLSKYSALLISDMTGNGSEDVIMNATDGFNSLGIQIFNEDGNITLETSLSNGQGEKIIAVDLDSNGKKDILVANKLFSYTKVEIELNIFSQDNDGNYTRKVYKTTLNNKVKEYEQVTDIVISDLNGEKNMLIVSSTDHIYILEIQNDELVIIKTLDYLSKKNKLSTKLLEPIDINHDGKKDLIVVEPNSINLLSIFIQKEDNNFFGEQNYFFYDEYGHATDLFNPTYTFGDINKDGKYEMFFSTGEDKLSTIYFK